MSDAYEVQPFDTLSSIARRHGCSVADLQSLNKISDPRKLAAGAVLQLPRIRSQDQTKRPVDKSSRPSTAPPKAGTSESEQGSWLEHIWPSLHKSEGTAEGGDRHKVSDALEVTQQAWLKGIRLGHGVVDSVLQWYREIESSEAVHKTTDAKTAKRKEDEQKRSQTCKKSDYQPKRHKDEVIADLHKRLHATPIVVSTSGVRLSRNERRMIVAAVGLCEINGDVFGSRNTDQEFVGRRFGKRGIQTGYSDIVHIGLSYGYIQFTQDGGNLGRLLMRMRAKNSESFRVLFPNADQLIQLTTDGLPGHDHYGKSGQAYWGKLPQKDKAELVRRASIDADGDKKPDNPLDADEEIRGARVQRIPYVVGYPAIDLWEDYATKATLPNGDEAEYFGYLSAFKAAGDIPAFQDAQIELAVEDYLNPVLAHCKAWNIRSGVGLAFVTACSVRGGSGSSLVRLLSKVAAAKFSIKSFATAQQERECLQAIASGAVDGVPFDKDEGRRAKLLVADQYHFLKEDLYDTSTYDAASDT